MVYRSPPPRRPPLRRPPRRDDPFHAYQKSEQYPNPEDLEVVPPPEPTCYAVFKDQRGKAKVPKGAFQRIIPSSKTLESKVEEKPKKTGIERKL